MSLSAASATEHAVAAGASNTERGISKINRVTGLSTDYLNHFTEVVMMLEMVASMPDCLDDLRAWRPKTYVEHFASSRFSDRDAVIASYEAADPAVREALDAASETLNVVLTEARDVVVERLDAAESDVLGQRAAAWLKPLIARTGAVINGTPFGGMGPQAAVDALLDQ